MANINDRINGQEFESASPLAHAVRYDRAQVKTEEQKKQARQNIGCYCEAGGGGGSSSGGGGSSGGGVFVVHAEEDDATGKDRLDKTAAEILEASKTMLVMAVNYNEYEEETSMQNSYMGGALKEDNNYNFKFYYNISNGNGIGADSRCIQYRAANDDDYPLLYNSDEDGDEPIN